MLFLSKAYPTNSTVHIFALYSHFVQESRAKYESLYGNISAIADTGRSAPVIIFVSVLLGSLL